MTRLINADALLKSTIYNPLHVPHITEQDVIKQPTVDAVPTEWIDKYTYENPLTCYEGFHAYIRNMICEWRKENE